MEFNDLEVVADQQCWGLITGFSGGQGGTVAKSVKLNFVTGSVMQFFTF